MAITFVPPVEFNSRPSENSWFPWSEIEECFWPGKGGRSEAVNPLLAKVKDLGGVYLLAWCDQAPACVSPSCNEVKYIGQTNFFRGRMGQFATSAGFWGKRDSGHSAGWRWPEGKKDKLLVAFFPVGNDQLEHIGEGLRHWMECLALEAYREAHSVLPEVNRSPSLVNFPSI